MQPNQGWACSSLRVPSIANCARDQSTLRTSAIFALTAIVFAQTFHAPPRLGQFGQSSEPLGLPVGGKPCQHIPDPGHETNVDGRRALASQVPRQPSFDRVSLHPAELLNQERVSRSLRRRLGQNPGVVTKSWQRRDPVRSNAQVVEPRRSIAATRRFSTASWCSTPGPQGRKTSAISANSKRSPTNWTPRRAGGD